ncbi:hypothetical protein AB7W78_04335 [Providencia rettgeri]
MLSEIIEKNKKIIKGEDIDLVVKKLYLSSPSVGFMNTDDSTYVILNQISNKFSVPFKHIYVTGSAHIGFSLKTSNEYSKGSSDLDIAIVDGFLFDKILNGIVDDTFNFTKKSSFKSFELYKSYINNVARGFIHPFYFPFGNTRKNWFDFFNELTLDHKESYSKISACLFSSEESFKNRQKYSINYFKANNHENKSILNEND